MSKHATRETVVRKYNQVEAARARKAEKQAERQKAFEANRHEWEQKVQFYLLAKVAFAISWLLAVASLMVNALRLWR